MDYQHLLLLLITYDRTYPTTYVEFNFISGGPSKTASVSGTCAFTTNSLALPTDAARHLIYPVTASISSRVVPFPQQFLDYLNSVPAVSQFAGSDVGKCSLSSDRVELVHLSTSDGTNAAPTMKVSVASL